MAQALKPVGIARVPPALGQDRPSHHDRTGRQIRGQSAGDAEAHDSRYALAKGGDDIGLQARDVSPSAKRCMPAARRDFRFRRQTAYDEQSQRARSVPPYMPQITLSVLPLARFRYRLTAHSGKNFE